MKGWAVIDANGVSGVYWRWMPYQLEQAAKA
jgi:hypothetical protein